MIAIVGLALTAVGVILGFNRPLIGARWADEDNSRREFWLGFRYVASIALVLVGTGLQIYAAWPS